jgi:hypothetical protein
VLYIDFDAKRNDLIQLEFFTVVLASACTDVNIFLNQSQSKLCGKFDPNMPVNPLSLSISELM